VNRASLTRLAHCAPTRTVRVRVPYTNRTGTRTVFPQATHSHHLTEIYTRLHILMHEAPSRNAAPFPSVPVPVSASPRPLSPPLVPLHRIRDERRSVWVYHRVVIVLWIMRHALSRTLSLPLPWILGRTTSSSEGWGTGHGPVHCVTRAGHVRVDTIDPGRPLVVRDRRDVMVLVVVLPGMEMRRRWWRRLIEPSYGG
jgi:hypothetical protein